MCGIWLLFQSRWMGSIILYRQMRQKKKIWFCIHSTKHGAYLGTNKQLNETSRFSCLNIHHFITFLHLLMHSPKHMFWLVILRSICTPCNPLLIPMMFPPWFNFLQLHIYIWASLQMSISSSNIACIVRQTYFLVLF